MSEVLSQLGVPQGSVPGPLIFLVYVHVSPSGLESYLSMFADDVELREDYENH